MEFTEDHMVFRVKWWIVSHDDFFPVHDWVSRAVIQALQDVGVVLPYTRGSVRVDMNSSKA